MRYHIMKKDDIYLRRAMWESYKKSVSIVEYL